MTDQNASRVDKQSNRLLVWLHRFEDSLLAIMLTSMIVLACVQILLRNTVGWNFTWGDPTVRVLVLWVGMLGALAASRGNRHITVDVLSTFMSARYKAWSQAIGSLFTAIICGLLAWYSLAFVREEFSFDTQGPICADWLAAGEATGCVPAWSLQAILPVCFALMSLRFAIWSISCMRAGWQQTESNA